VTKENARAFVLAYMHRFGATEKEAQDALTWFCTKTLEDRTAKWLHESLSDLSVQDLRAFPSLIKEQDDTQEKPRGRGRPRKAD